MTLYEALKAARQWGDTVQFADGKITVTKADSPHHGMIVSVPSLSVPDGKARDADVKRVWKTAAHFGPDMVVGLKGAKLVLTHPDRGQASVPTAPARLTVPTPPDRAWTTLSPVMLTRVRQAALAASSDDHGSWGMNGVRLTPHYVAATDGQVVVVVWSPTGLSDGVTLTVEGIRRLPTDTDTDFAVSGARGWFRAADCLYWTALVATPWPDAVITDVIPTRREADSLTIPVPEGWTDGVKGAALTDHDADNPAVLSADDTKLTLTIPRVFERDWVVPGLSIREPVGINAHLLMKATKLLPADDDAYLSIAGPLQPVMVYTTGKDAVEVLVSAHYLPTASR